jgi:hypothetical protein
MRSPTQALPRASLALGKSGVLSPLRREAVLLRPQETVNEPLAHWAVQASERHLALQSSRNLPIKSVESVPICTGSTVKYLHQRPPSCIFTPQRNSQKPLGGNAWGLKSVVRPSLDGEVAAARSRAAVVDDLWSMTDR